MYDKELESIGKRIQTLRKRKGWSQEMLAEKLNISRNTLTKLEGGFRDFKTTEMLSIAKALGVSTDYLLGLEPACDHATADICKETALAPEAVDALRMLANDINTHSELTELVRVKSSAIEDFQIKALNHLVANCNSVLFDIGLYLFGELYGIEHVGFKDTSITIATPATADEILRNGILQKMTAGLANYRKQLLEHGGDLPLTHVSDARRADRTSDTITYTRGDAKLMRKLDLKRLKGQPLAGDEIAELDAIATKITKRQRKQTDK